MKHTHKKYISFKTNCINYEGHPIIRLPGKYEDYKNSCITVHLITINEESSQEEKEQYLWEEMRDIVINNVPYVENIDEKTMHKKSLWFRIKGFLS